MTTRHNFSPIHPQKLFLERDEIITPVKKNFNDSFNTDIAFPSPRVYTPNRNLGISQSFLLTPTKSNKLPLSSPQYIDALISEKVDYSKRYIRDELDSYLSKLDRIIEKKKYSLSEKQDQIRSKRKELEMLRYLELNEISLY